MGKLKLDPERLTVESFNTTGLEKEKGTVFGEQCTCYTNCTCPGCPTCDATCLNTCAYTCDDASCAGQATCGNTCGDTCDGATCYDSCNLSCAQSCGGGWSCLC